MVHVLHFEPAKCAALCRLDCLATWLHVIPTMVIILNALAIGVSLDVYRGLAASLAAKSKKNLQTESAPRAYRGLVIEVDTLLGKCWNMCLPLGCDFSLQCCNGR